MSTENRVNQLRAAFEGLKKLDPFTFLQSPPNFNDYDGPNIKETTESLRFIFGVLDALFASKTIDVVPFVGVVNLQSHVQNTSVQYSALISTRDQGTYQNFAGQVDATANLVRNLGLPQLVAGGAQLETLVGSAQTELEKLKANNADIAQLKKEVKNLITPAAAHAMSTAFAKRGAEITRGRFLWLLFSFALGAFASYETFDVAKTIADVMKASSQASHFDFFWPAVVVRSIVLIPLFAAFGFTIAQYRKERDFEEEYAHKAALAISLPNYGDLVSPGPVRDQIVTAATTVIFNSPTALSKDADQSSAAISGMKEMAEMIGKVLPKRG